jgi:hypothetical protein
MVDLIDTDEARCEFELSAPSQQKLWTDGNGLAGTYHVVSQRNNHELRILGSLLDVGRHNRNLM